MSFANLNGKSAVTDQSKAEAFAGRMLDVLNSSLLGLMISIDYQTHLFDVMSRLSSPSTSAEIANATNLNERYVREWLGAMVTGKIVEYNPDTSRYRLSRSHIRQSPIYRSYKSSSNLGQGRRFV